MEESEVINISNLISSDNSFNQRIGISIGLSNGLKLRDFEFLFLDNGRGWIFEYSQCPWVSEDTYASFKKVLCSNTFEIIFNFEKNKIKSIETVLNEQLILCTKVNHVNSQSIKDSIFILRKYIKKLLKKEILKHTFN